MGINNILEIGRQGLAASRAAMQIASNNVANANTPGYTRQKAVLEAHAQNSTSGVRVGGGVHLKDAMRVHDTFVETQLLNEAKGYGSAKAISSALQKAEGLLSNDKFNMSDMVNNFFNSVRELSANPEQPALKVNVVEAAKNTAYAFREMNQSLNSLKLDLDAQLETNVTQANALAHELGTLNSAIQKFDATHETPNELLDRRDAVVRELSQSLGLDAMTDQFNGKNITVGGVGILVNGHHVNELFVMRSPAEGGKSAGSLDVYLRTPDGNRKITSAINEGEIGGLINVRDSVISNAIAQLDRTAFTLAEQVNQIHEQGTGSDGSSGNRIFKTSDEVHDASYFLDVSDDLEDLSKVAVGYDGAAPSDNRVALALADLQDAKILPSSLSGVVSNESHVSFNDALNGILGEVGMKAKYASQNLQQTESVVRQLENYRENISGVSLEEESINLAKFQATFNASAKAMKVGSELFETILGIAR